MSLVIENEQKADKNLPEKNLRQASQQEDLLETLNELAGSVNDNGETNTLKKAPSSLWVYASLRGLFEYVFLRRVAVNYIQEFRRILSWSKASLERLAVAEEALLNRCRVYVSSKMVNVRLWKSSIYTITAKAHADALDHKTPFVLIHGFGAGIAMWAGNLDKLAEKRTVHAFDILGFGRSSRPQFSGDATLAELEFVQSIEDWRKEMNIEQMILVGHSFGGYLATSYTLEHPERVRHLILADPWGFPVKPQIEQVHIPVWMRFVGSMLAKFNPLATLRFVGPFGPALIKKLRSDLGTRYAFENPEAIYEYIYQCNAQKPTGEIAFSTMTRSFGWAKRPMINRINNMDPKTPVTFICGSKSWIDSGPAYEIQARRPDAYVDVQLLSGAGHHVYADAADAFNSLCASVSEIVDAEEDLKPNVSQSPPPAPTFLHN